MYLTSNGVRRFSRDSLQALGNEQQSLRSRFDDDIEIFDSVLKSEATKASRATAMAMKHQAKTLLRMLQDV